MDLTGYVVATVLLLGIGGYMTCVGWLAPEMLKEWFKRYRIRMSKWMKIDPYFEYSTRPLVILWTWRLAGPMFFIMGLAPAAATIITILK